MCRNVKLFLDLGDTGSQAREKSGKNSGVAKYLQQRTIKIYPCLLQLVGSRLASAEKYFRLGVAAGSAVQCHFKMAMLLTVQMHSLRHSLQMLS